jgi:hypothetical protein
MSVVVEGWECDECPIPDGIYFPDDSYFSLEGFVVAEQRLAVASTSAMGKVYVDTPLAENSRFEVYGGETSWEGCGYLALVSKPDRTLVWILHSSTSEPFREAQLQSDVIAAISSEFPCSYRWHVPIIAPWKLAVEQLDRP